MRHVCGGGAVCGPCVGYVWAMCWLCVGFVVAMCGLCVGFVVAMCVLCVGCVWTVYGLVFELCADYV